MERVLGGGSGLPFRHAFARLAPQATAPELRALYRELLHRCGISAVTAAEGEVQFLRSQEELDRVHAMGPMQVLRAVAMPQDVPHDA
jgi:hypothetical protein